MALDPVVVGSLPDLIYGIAALSIGIFVFVADPRGPTNRTFALMMGLLGARFILTDGWYILLGENLTSRDLSDRTGNALQIASALAVVRFFSIYPTRRGPFSRPLGTWTLVVLGAATFALQATWPTLFNYGGFIGENGLPAGTHAGPLLAIPPTSTAWALGMLLAFLAYRQAHAGPVRGQLLLLTLGFGFASMQSRVPSIDVYVSGPFIAPEHEIFDITNRAVGALCLATSVFVAFALLGDARETRSRSRLAGGLLLAVGVLVYVLTRVSNASPDDSATFLAARSARAALALGLPLFVGYAILEHQLLDIDLKVKWTLRRGTLAGIFVAVFVVATQIGQNVLSAEYGLVAGGVLTGLLLFAIAPLQRLADRVANAAMPGVDATPASRSEQRLSVYRGAVSMALQDRVLSRDEERTLASLAAELGIDARAALAVREDVERELGI